MARMIVQRLALALLTLFLVSIILFAGTEALPGDTAELILGMEATPDTLAALREKLGLHRTPAVRYIEWLTQLMRGDLGTSLAANSKAVGLVDFRVRNSALLGLLVAAIAVPVAIVLGLLAAMRPGSLLDRLLTATALGCASVPEFVIASLLVLLFSVHLDWLPAISNFSANDHIYMHGSAMVLPVMALSLTVIPQIARMTRATVLNVMSSPYIEMAILKGLAHRHIVLRHALPNAIGPITNIVALNLAYLLSGAFIIETMFSFPGLAYLMVESVRLRDAPLALFCGTTICALYVLLILVADIASILSNPRLRFPK